MPHQPPPTRPSHGAATARRARRRLGVCLGVLAVLLTAARPAAAVSPATATSALPVTKVLVVVEENHSLTQMRTQMPYLRGLAVGYGYATGYTGLTYPSLPNYLAIAGGSTFGVRDDGPPAAHPLHGPSVFGQALARGRTAQVYAEGQPTPCDRTPAGAYQVKHNPWPYFTDERAACLRHDVSTASFSRDARANALPTVGMLVPNACHDAHDCPLSSADAWLHQRLPAVLGSRDFRTGRLLVVVTADTDDRSAHNSVLTVVLHRSLQGRHRVVARPLDHLSLARLYAQVCHAVPLRAAGRAPDLAAAFGLAVA